MTIAPRRSGQIASFVPLKKSHPGLPDGFFSDQKSQFGYFLEDLGMENIVIILVIYNILLPLDIFYGHLVIL
jgi:hypothetical protein